MKKSHICCVILCLLLGLTKAHAANNSCSSPSPSNAPQVFECFTSQPTPYVSNYGLIGCNQLSTHYIFMLRKAGASKTLIEQPPSCSMFAKVIEKMSGTTPFWQSCVNYDGSKQHFAQCTSAFIQQSSKVKTVNAHCQIITNLYLSALSLASNRPNTLQSSYKALSCDDMIDAISATELEVVGEECLRFTPNDIADHIKRCMMNEPQVINRLDTIDCNTLRTLYQFKLTLAYGTMPSEYKVLDCSELNQIIDQLKLQAEKTTHASTQPNRVEDVAKIPDTNPVNLPSEVAISRRVTLRENSRKRVSTALPQSTETAPNVNLQPIVKVAPQYPIKAEKDGLEGWVKLRFNINELGRVRDIELLSASHPRIFDRNAKRALQKWQYMPHLVDGKPSKTIGHEETIEFTLPR